MEVSQENIYRTRWLMAHNALQEVISKLETTPRQHERYEEYLRELKTAETVAAQLA